MMTASTSLRSRISLYLRVVGRLGFLTDSCAAMWRESYRSHAATHWDPGTRSDACSNSHPRTPVPMEANRTVSLGATGLGDAQSPLGSRRVNFAAAPAAVT